MRPPRVTCMLQVVVALPDKAKAALKEHNESMLQVMLSLTQSVKEKPSLLIAVPLSAVPFSLWE